MTAEPITTTTTGNSGSNPDTGPDAFGSGDRVVDGGSIAAVTTSAGAVVLMHMFS